MNVFQSIAILVVLQGAVLVGCSSIDTINRTVNDYPYCPDKPNERVKAMGPDLCGDCDDYAYTKCLAIEKLNPEAEFLFLYRARTQTSPPHAALAYNGQVLDNQHRRTYKHDPGDWLASAKMTCEQIQIHAR